jgi:type IV pilus assembly protein PilB
MILLSGPTGSGKTTTLYGMVKELDRDTKNVLSLEDPVEYSIPGLNQSQVKPEIGYTFANGLRTTLRQDPDIIMVGEIRDKETAQLAVQAALTGHLVLSTIHTNNAIGVIPRLIDMGVDPYLIAPTLNLAIAQRLVRKLMPGTGKDLSVDGSIAVMIEKEFETLPEKYKKEFLGDYTGKSVKEAVPTKESPTGTKGRIGVYEMMPMTKELEAVILNKPVETEIEAEARKHGMITMKEDAIIKALNGIIPFSEVGTLGREFLSEED